MKTQNRCETGANLKAPASPDKLKRISPVLKWAGGKAQLLDHLLPLVPAQYGKYIEPFVGGGALFFALLPKAAIIADANPDLISFYECVRDNVDGVIECARKWATDKSTFYEVRGMDPKELASDIRAARLLYLNRTCFNGLYRVNKLGQFNVPFGGYLNPRIGNEQTLRAASQALASATIICGDYSEVLRTHASEGDFVFLDPPYVPVSQHSDFKRYTREQFRVEEHQKLADEMHRLSKLGCSVILTNSNTPLTRQLYAGFDWEVFPTRRNISSDGRNRKGEDLIVRTGTARDVEPASAESPKSRGIAQPTLFGPTFSSFLSPQVSAYPPTRFMGSKEKLLAEIWSIVSQFPGNRVLDLFSGSGAVSYMLKAQGKAVTSNDYMTFSWAFSRAMVENSSKTLSPEVISFLTSGNPVDDFVQRTFGNRYFTDEDNRFIDTVRSRIWELDGDIEKTIARVALIRACMKKRARGIFTYVGLRYDDGRRDLRVSLKEHFVDAATAVNLAIFDNGLRSEANNLDALSVRSEADVVYIDPPYYSKLSDNDYVRRYHFVEGLARDWIGVEMQPQSKTHKFKTYGSPFSTYAGTVEALETIFRRYSESALVVSYSSNSLPDKETMLSLLRKVKGSVEIIPVDHRYSFGNQGHKLGNVNNRVSEYLFVAP